MHPDNNGQRIARLESQQISYAAVKFCNSSFQKHNENDKTKSKNGNDEEKTNGVKKVVKMQQDTEMMLNYILSEVQSCKSTLNDCKGFQSTLPPSIDMRKIENSPKRPIGQFHDSLSWSVEPSTPDPGQAKTLGRYIPIDFLQLPVVAKTRDQAISALRYCDRLCELLDNQEHCIKNRQFLIQSIIQHTLTRVVPIPKPRNVDVADRRKFKLSQRSTRKKQQEMERRAQKEKRKQQLADNLQQALEIGMEVANTFSEIPGMSGVLGQAVESSGYIRPTSIQCNVFSKVRFNSENSKINLILRSPPGSGKSLCSLIICLDTIKNAIKANDKSTIKEYETLSIFLTKSKKAGKYLCEQLQKIVSKFPAMISTCKILSLHRNDISDNETRKALRGGNHIIFGTIQDVVELIGINMLKLNSTSLFIVQNTDIFMNDVEEKAVINFQTILSSATNCDSKSSGRLLEILSSLLKKSVPSKFKMYFTITRYTTIKKKQK